jgi:phosphate:Na+ symporter
MLIGFGDLIQIFGSLSFFIFGMKMMSDGVQRAAGSQIRNILNIMTRNRILGVFSGFLITAIIQSSSATTVMTVSFVNAGLLTLFESAGVMMGANIGTTITGWIVSYLGFEVKLDTYSIPLFAIGVPMLFSNRSNVKYWGEFIIGFAILFLALSYLKDAVPDLSNDENAVAFLKRFTEWGVFSNLFFVLLGTVLTMIIQSSSAAMTMTITMCAQGWLPFEVGAAMILGENIGTTLTAELAAVVGNVQAKRSARIHSLFNIIGVSWMVWILPWFLPLLSIFLVNVFGFDDPLSPEGMPLGLSAFHTAFNTLNVILLLGFVPWLIKLASLTVREKKDEGDEDAHLKFISSLALTPELAIIELQKEAAHYGEITRRMSGFLHTILNSADAKEQRQMLKKIKKYEEITDDMEIEITEYITKLADKEITPKTSMRLRSVLNIANDLERIGDIYYQMSITLEKKIEDKIYFLPEQREGLNKIIALVEEAFKEMANNLATPNYDDVVIDKAKNLEKKINDLRDELRDENNNKLGDADYNVNSAMIYNNLFSSLERIGDHIINVNESIVGEI